MIATVHHLHPGPFPVAIPAQKHLSNGLAVQIAEVTPRDRKLVHGFLRGKSGEHLAQLFLEALEEERALVPRERLALPVVRPLCLGLSTMEAGEQRLLGIGTSHPLDLTEAEVALLVDEDLDEVGVEQALLDQLVVNLREQGIQRICTFVLPGEIAILNALHHSGRMTGQIWEGGVSRIELNLR